VTAPAAVLHDRRSPAPRTLAWPLSELIVAPLRNGETHGRASGPAAAVRASLPWRLGCASPAGALLDWAAQQRRKRGGLMDRERDPMLTCLFPLVEGGEA
jgi:hypothetical protein